MTGRNRVSNLVHAETDYHTPVMLNEALEALAISPGGRYCDGTVGGAGHARQILRCSAPDGVLVGLDRDPAAIAISRRAVAEFGERAILCRASFADMLSVLDERSLVPVDGILLDLGVSSHQLDTAERGFSFGRDGPLDMRMDPEALHTAADLLARLTDEQLATILRDYGEERHARPIARAIKRAVAGGRLNTTRDLAALVASVYHRRQPAGAQRSAAHRIHPATRTFQALRIAVNDELGALERFLDTFVDALRPGGRLVVIAFHSLEDRAVKRCLAHLADPCTCPPSLPRCGCGQRARLRLVARRARRPSAEETRRNPRARSARLRAAERL